MGGKCRILQLNKSTKKRTENRRRDGREVPNSVVEQKYKKNGKIQLVSQWVFSMSFKITKVKLLFLG